MNSLNILNDKNDLTSSQKLRQKAFILLIAFGLVSLLYGISNVMVGWLIGFNGISTSISYLMPKPVYTYVRFVQTLWVI